MFEKTGCLITADGSDDDKISSEGLPNYKVLPPCLIDPTAALPTANNVESDPNENEIMVEGFDIEGELLADNDHLEDDSMIEDREADRIFDHDAAGKRVKALYEHGRFLGDIMYFNTKFREYKVIFADGSIDYISKHDIDGMGIMLV